MMKSMANWFAPGGGGSRGEFLPPMSGCGAAKIAAVIAAFLASGAAMGWVLENFH